MSSIHDTPTTTPHPCERPVDLPDRDDWGLDDEIEIVPLHPAVAALVKAAREAVKESAEAFEAVVEFACGIDHDPAIAATVQLAERANQRLRAALRPFEGGVS